MAKGSGNTKPLNMPDRLRAIEQRRNPQPDLDDHDRRADDALLELWEIIEREPETADVDLPALRDQWWGPLDQFRAERHRGGFKRSDERTGKGGTLPRDGYEPHMPERLADADRLALAAMGIEV